MTEREQLQFIRSISGAPATILVLLIMRGASMTGRDIGFYTGYHVNTITVAMRTLDGLGLTQYNGRAHGWSLNASQLSLPLIHSLTAPVDKEITKIVISASSSSSSSSSSSNKEEGRRKEEQLHRDHKNCDLSTSRDHKNCDLLIHNPGQTEGERKISDLLRLAGLQSRSKKFREIMAAGLDVEFVAENVAARLYDPAATPPGWLITRLLNDEMPPPSREGWSYLDLCRFRREINDIDEILDR